jgi:hypothetical protein
MTTFAWAVGLLKVQTEYSWTDKSSFLGPWIDRPSRKSLSQAKWKNGRGNEKTVSVNAPQYSLDSNFAYGPKLFSWDLLGSRITAYGAILCRKSITLVCRVVKIYSTFQGRFCIWLANIFD